MKIVVTEHTEQRYCDGTTETVRVDFKNDQGKLLHTGRGFATLAAALAYVEGAQAAAVALGEFNRSVERRTMTWNGSRWVEE